MANQPKARLDMGHGFMKCIIKNQVERDNYDKEVKAKLNEKSRGNQSKMKKPELQTYVPPSRSKMKQGIDKGSWFDLEYEDNFGDIHRVTVNKGDELEALAQSFGEDVGLSETLIQALSIKLHEEVEKRSNGRVS